MLSASVANLVRDYGTDILHFRYIETDTDLYQEGVAEYEDPVTLRCRGIKAPRPEVLSIIGAEGEAEVAFLFARDMLAAAYPFSGEGEWIDARDELEFEGRRYRLGSVHLTGKIKDRCSLVVALARTAAGEAEDAYP